MDYNNNLYGIFFLWALLTSSKAANIKLSLIGSTDSKTTASIQGGYIDKNSGYVLFINSNTILSYGFPVSPVTTIISSVSYTLPSALSFVISPDRSKIYSFTSDGYVKCLDSTTGTETISTDTKRTDITGMAISNDNGRLLLYSATTPMSVWTINLDDSITLLKQFDSSTLTNQAFFYGTEEILLLDITNKFIYLINYSSGSVVKSTFLSLDGTDQKFVEMAVSNDFHYFGYIRKLQTSTSLSDLSTLKIIDIQNPLSFVEKLSFDQQAHIKLRFYPTSPLIMVLYLSSTTYLIAYHNYLDTSKTYTVTYGTRTNLASTTITSFASFPLGEGFITATTGIGRSWKYTCSSSCNTCKFPVYEECASCPVGSPYLIQDTAACAASCPTGYSADNTAKTCSLCDQTCLTCSPTNPSNCLTCQTSSPYYWQSQYTCHSGSCPDGSYLPNGNLNICSSCDPTCKTCIGSASNQCISCQSPLPYLIESQSTCQSASCPVGTFEVTGKICRACDTTVCASCQVSSTSCLSCINPNYFLWQEQGSCHANVCPVGSYLFSSKLCNNCASSCSTCSTTSTSCDSCPGNFPYFWQSARTCHAGNCPDGSYLSNSELKTCTSCNPDCATCTGPDANNCQSCASASMHLWTEVGICYATCPEGSYSDSVSTCASCDPSCRSCTNTGSSNCASCKVSAPFFLETLKQCSSSSCPDGTFEFTNKVCKDCDPSCQTCSGTAAHCLACKVASPWYWRSRATCSSGAGCPAGTNLISGYVCDTCFVGCEECMNIASCNKCQADYYLFDENSSGLFTACLHKGKLYDGIFVFDDRLNGFGEVRKCRSKCFSCFNESRCSKCKGRNSNAP